MALWASQLAVLSGLAMVEAHALSLAALYGQGARVATRNAVVLAARDPGGTLVTVVLGAGGLALCGILGGAPVGIVPAVLALYAVTATSRLVSPEPRKGT